MSQICGEAVDKVLTSAMEMESMDNLSVVLISFQNFTNFIKSLVDPQQGIVDSHQQQLETAIQQDR